MEPLRAKSRSTLSSSMALQWHYHVVVALIVVQSSHSDVGTCFALTRHSGTVKLKTASSKSEYDG